MIHEDTIHEVVNKLVEAYSPLEIYLFGSYAWGHPTKESDLDWLIVVEHSDLIKYKRPLAGYKALREIDVANEIIVYTKKEFQKNATDITTLIYKIKHEGKLLYAKA